MQKWEYLFIGADYDEGVVRPIYVNDQPLPDWKKGPTLSVYVNQLGEQGWELVAAPYTERGGTASTPRLIFKRPIE